LRKTADVVVEFEVLQVLVAHYSDAELLKERAIWLGSWICQVDAYEGAFLKRAVQLIAEVFGMNQRDWLRFKRLNGKL
jgi:hypothetical protein